MPLGLRALPAGRSFQLPAGDVGACTSLANGLPMHLVQQLRQPLQLSGGLQFYSTQ